MFRRAQLLVLVFVTVLLASSCEYPRDADGTLDRARGGTLRVGVGQRMPWAGWDGDQPVGAEVELVEQMAGRLHTRIQWTRGSDEELLHALEEEALDLVAAGLEAESAWATKVSFTRSFVDTRTVLAVEPGVPKPKHLKGATVATAPDSVDAALLREHGARVVPEDRHDVPTLVEDWQLNRELRPTGIELTDAKHVLALPLGENAWLLRVNRLLVGSSPRARRALKRVEGPGG